MSEGDEGKVVLEEVDPTPGYRVPNKVLLWGVDVGCDITKGPLPKLCVSVGTF